MSITSAELPNSHMPSVKPKAIVALLTGGSDRPYVFGLTNCLTSAGVSLDLVGSDELDCPGISDDPAVNFLNLRGSLSQEASLVQKISRLSRYYLRLIRYAAQAKPRIFHILWNNKFEFFDRTLLMLYYKLLGKNIVLTVHNVNTARRDSEDTYLNRFTLGVQFRLADHIFTHTEKMKRELMKEFRVQENRLCVIPFGINNAVPNTRMTPHSAKQRLGIGASDRTILFFGRIAPYKGLEHLIAAFRHISAKCHDYRLLIAGRADNCEAYWNAVRQMILDDAPSGRVLLRAEFIPDEETEVYFKAADVLVLPYKDIYQSGVLFLGYSFGLPAIATDVGSFSEDIVEGKTGFVCKSDEPDDIAQAIETFFESNVYRQLDEVRSQIREYAHKRNSWETVADMTRTVYANLQGRNNREAVSIDPDSRIQR
ncbi:MAG: glycosyltransferase family 4 protein [Bryobacteraceae bacterium]